MRLVTLFLVIMILAIIIVPEDTLYSFLQKVEDFFINIFRKIFFFVFNIFKAIAQFVSDFFSSRWQEIKNFLKDRISEERYNSLENIFNRIKIILFLSEKEEVPERD